jgi:hypothetical protein
MGLAAHGNKNLLYLIPLVRAHEARVNCFQRSYLSFQQFGSEESTNHSLSALCTFPEGPAFMANNKRT